MNKYLVKGYLVQNSTFTDWEVTVEAHSASDAVTQVEVAKGIRDAERAASACRYYGPNCSTVSHVNAGYNRISFVKPLPVEDAP